MPNRTLEKCRAVETLYIYMCHTLVSKFCRNEGEHGGSAIYARKNLKCKEREDITALTLHGKFKCAAIESNLGKEIALFICIYRSPLEDMTMFFERLELLLTRILR